MKYRKSIVVAGVLAAIVTLGVFLRLIDSGRRFPTDPPEIAGSGGSKIDPRSPGERAGGANASGGSISPADTWDVPDFGLVHVHEKDRKIEWNDNTGKRFVFPFQFFYADNGIWIRAVYLNGPDKYPEPSAENLADLYAAGGQKIVGIPDHPPRIPLDEILTATHRLVHFEDASKIVLEHVLYKSSNDFVRDPVVMVKVWGVQKAWPDSPETIPRVRVTFGMDSKLSFLDDAL